MSAHSIRSIFFILACLASLSTAWADEIKLPAKWKKPSALELDGEWRTRDTKRFSVVEGDFNGDGLVDQARLLISTHGHRLGLIIFLASKSGEMKSYQVVVEQDPSAIHTMGIAKVLPGKYKTACGKGYWECKNDDTPEVLIKLDAIEYFKEESASSYFLWDAKKKLFKRVWVSD